VKISTRTCVACRETAEKKHLLRLVFVDKQIILDKENNMLGRGCYVHNLTQCIASLEVGRLLRAWKLGTTNRADSNMKVLLEKLKHSLKNVLET
jgi:predicted RNA-binding protein YlxR (DUF448 family)